MATGAAAGALACLAVGSSFGGVHTHTVHQRVIAWSLAGGFVVLGSVAVHSAADGIYRFITFRQGRPGGGPARILASLAGYLVVLFITLGMVRVPLGHLLLGGAITGVIVGIAAQQALGNAFAGIVLLLARPFTVGMRVRLKAGALGGELVGTVRDMSLTYTVLDTDEGRLSVPNSGVLAAAAGPAVSTDDGQAPAPLVLHPRQRNPLRFPLPSRDRGQRTRTRTP